METNYFGAIRCIQAVLPGMRQRRSGCIINVSSVGGRISSPPLSPYNASKWALEALSEGLAGEMKTLTSAWPSWNRASLIPPWRAASEIGRSVQRTASVSASLPFFRPR